MHRLTATDTPMVRYTRTIFPSYANIKIKGKNPYDVLAFTLTQKCSAQCEKQVSLFTGGTCFVCFNIEGI